MSASNAGKPVDVYQGMPHKRLRAIRRLKPSKRRPKVRMWDVCCRSTFNGWESISWRTKDRFEALRKKAEFDAIYNKLSRDTGKKVAFYIELRRSLVKR